MSSLFEILADLVLVNREIRRQDEQRKERIESENVPARLADDLELEDVRSD